MPIYRFYVRDSTEPTTVVARSYEADGFGIVSFHDVTVLDGKPGEARTLRARTSETGVETIDD